MSSRSASVAALLLVFFAALATPSSAPAAPSVIGTIPIGFDPGETIATDSRSYRAYVPDYQDTFVRVVDGATVTTSTTIPTGSGHIGAVSTNGRIWLTNYGNSMEDYLTVIQVSSNKVIASVFVGSGSYPRGLAVGSGGTVYTANNDSGSVSAISPSTFKVIGTVKLGKVVDAIAASPKTGMVYAHDWKEEKLYVLDAALNIVAKIPVGKIIRDVAVDPDTNTIYASGGSKVQVIDGATNSVVGNILMPHESFDLEIDPGAKMLWVNVDPGPGGLLVTVDLATKTIVGQLPLSHSIIATGIDAYHHRIYASGWDPETAFAAVMSVIGTQ